MAQSDHASPAKGALKRALRLHSPASSKSSSLTNCACHPSHAQERFDFEFFMTFLLPPIIFEAGFNLQVTLVSLG